MQNQAPYQNVLRLSIGLGSVFNIFCAPAIAEISEDVALESAVKTVSQHRQPDLETSESKTVQRKLAEGDRLREHPFAVEDGYRPQFSFSALCQLQCTALEWLARDGADGGGSIPDSADQSNLVAGSLAVGRAIAAPHSKTEAPADLSAAKLPLPENGLPEDELPKGLADLLAGAQPLPSEVAQVPNLSDILPRATDSARARDLELGVLRVQQLRSRQDEDLGILRLLQTAQAPPPPPRQPIAFLAGNLGFLSTDNSLRSESRISDQVYQSGLTFYLFPRLSERTSLYAIADVGLARYEESESELYDNLLINKKTGLNYGINYNKLELQLGIRQQLSRRTFAQIGWRNQRLYSVGFRDRAFAANFLEALISHRAILNNRMWLDSFYQARLGFADPQTANRFRQTFTLALNYGVSQDFRTSLLYQLDLDDYTRVDRYDIYQQLLGVVSYELTPESRISLFGGTRFGYSSSASVNLDDTFYGAGLNINVPLF